MLPVLGVSCTMKVFVVDQKQVEGEGDESVSRSDLPVVFLFQRVPSYHPDRYITTPSS